MSMIIASNTTVKIIFGDFDQGVSVPVELGEGNHEKPRRLAECCERAGDPLRTIWPLCNAASARRRVPNLQLRFWLTQTILVGHMLLALLKPPGSGLAVS